jgi:hypothetical protein
MNSIFLDFGDGECQKALPINYDLSQLSGDDFCLILLGCDNFFLIFGCDDFCLVLGSCDFCLYLKGNYRQLLHFPPPPATFSREFVEVVF